ncbi:MAG TPA: heavy metal transport/detoxification protein [Bacteroidales bacterium]|nr:heavy metal transport/detoxification protein [Bacteroidales bacterium]
MKVGFHCPGGKAKIEKTLSEMDGVTAYTVNLETKEVEVTFDKNKTSENRLADAMLNLGYTVNGKAPKEAHKCEGGHTEGEHKETQE